MKFFSGFFILLIALFLQLFLGSAGWHFNLALAVLIALAFVFDFWELIVCDFLTVFILNWPAANFTLIAFFFIPVAIFLIRKTIHPEPWIGVLVAILFGFLAFYGAAAPAYLASHVVIFLEDLAIGLAAGEVALVLLSG